MADVRGTKTDQVDWDLVAGALHALADLIESCEVDRQLIEFDPDELRQHATALEAMPGSPRESTGAPPQRPRLRDTLATAVARVAPSFPGNPAAAPDEMRTPAKPASLAGPVDPVNE
jgi:hypothetical protein